MREKVIIFIASLIIASELMTINAAAYIDPSATSYVIQIVVGIVVGGSAVAGVVISRLKKKAKDKLGIDLERKENEADVHVYDAEDDVNDDDSIGS